MDVEAFAKMIPETPPRALLRWAEQQTDELGEAAYTSYRCEWVPRAPTMEMLMDNNTRATKIRATVCECTECGQEWITKKGETAESFFVVEGEDGQTYSTDVGDDVQDPGLYYIEVAAGDGLVCPYCGTETEVIRGRDIKGGRTKRLQVAQLLNVGRYTTILYWLVEREISPGGTCISAAPRYAYALDESGRIEAFSHRRSRGMAPDAAAESWRPVKGTGNRWNSLYYDWGSINGRKEGTVCWPETPSQDEMEGTTGEKTGLARYWADAKSEFGVTYLKAWQKFPAVENVVNAGHARLVNTILYDAACYGYDLGTELGKSMDTTKTKPHEILRMTKADLKALGKGATRAELQILQRYRQIDKKTPLAEISRELWRADGQTVLQQMEAYGGSLKKYEAYMGKQGMRLGEIRTLADTRRVAQELHPDTPLTEEELWPSHLQAAHDRLTAQIAVAKSQKKTAELQAGFDAVLAKYAGIQWTDGRLAVILPRSNEDLVREGATLRHCVGGYGSRHAGGKEIILFIRHARRPERSYYTLNIGLDRSKPYEIQLHGYGNERHGPKKEYTHKIPAAVREFVDRWEKEILLPWAAKQAKRKKEDNAA